MYEIQNKEFKNLFEILCRRHDRYSIFYDFVKMCAISLYNSFAKNQEKEEEYLKIINSYPKEEQEIFVKMFAKLIEMYNDSKDIIDILGPMYMTVKSKNDKLGQVFTPGHISDLMAKLTISENNLQEEIEQKGFITVNDPTCGAGRFSTIICESIKRTKY